MVVTASMQTGIGACLVALGLLILPACTPDVAESERPDQPSRQSSAMDRTSATPRSLTAIVLAHLEQEVLWYGGRENLRGHMESVVQFGSMKRPNIVSVKVARVRSVAAYECDTDAGYKSLLCIRSDEDNIVELLRWSGGDTGEPAWIARRQDGPTMVTVIAWPSGPQKISRSVVLEVVRDHAISLTADEAAVRRGVQLKKFHHLANDFVTPSLVNHRSIVGWGVVDPS